MTHIILFSATIGAAPAKLTISITQNFDCPDPFVVRLGTDNWPLATADAEHLSAAGRRIEGTLDYDAQRNGPVAEAAFFRRQLGNSDGRGSTFEIGIHASGQFAAVYLLWNGKRAIDASGRLLKALAVLGEATTTIRQAAPSRVHDLRINPENFRSPYGWDGRAPWET